MAGISTSAGRAGLVRLGDFFIDSKINGTVDLTSDTLIEEYIDHLMTVAFVPITNDQYPRLQLQPANYTIGLGQTSQASAMGVSLGVSHQAAPYGQKFVLQEKKAFSFFEIIELQNKLTSKRLKEIKDKLKFANLAKKYVALGRNSVVQNSTETAVVSGSTRYGQRHLKFSFSEDSEPCVCFTCCEGKIKTNSWHID